MREDLIAKGYKPPQNNMPKQLHATFTNSGKDAAMENAELYFEAMLWGKLGRDDPDLRSNTYEGHRWNVRVNGKVVKKFVIGKEKTQIFEIWERLAENKRFQMVHYQYREYVILE